MIDVNKELGKLASKKDRLAGQLKKVEDAMSIADYENKVPEDIRKKNLEKVSCLVLEALMNLNWVCSKYDPGVKRSC